MSEAMTNREIEDVLSSIRRLVSQEGARPETLKAETLKAETPRAEPGRLILTASQRVDTPAQAVAERPAEPAATLAPAPPALARGEPTATPDLRQLEATIAELEAAVSASGASWEPDGTDPAPAGGAAGPSNVTALYAKPNFVHRPAVAEPEQRAAAPLAVPDDADGDDAGIEEAGIEEAVIDEAMLRALVAQMVREELHGQLGERITLQVRKLVRAEIARALEARNII